MLGDSKIEDLTLTLYDLRKKLLWLVAQKPKNAEQEQYIKEGKRNLIKVNSLLEGFGAKLPD